MDDTDRARARGFHQRGGTAVIGEIRIGAGAEQRFGDVDVSGQCGGHQGGTFRRAAHVRIRAMLEQRLHAARVVVADAGGEQQRGLRARDFTFRTAIEQELGDIPARVHACDAECGETFAVDGIDVGGRIEQQRGDDRFGAARGVMQRRVAVGAGDARIGAVREQRHHRVRTSLITVARRGDQRRQTAVRAIDIDAFGDESAQETQIRQRHRDDQRAALVALVRAGRRVGIAAAIERRESEIDLAGTRGAEQRRVEIGSIDAGGEIGALDVGHIHARAPRTAARATGVRKHRTQTSIDENEMCYRHEDDRVQRERNDTEFARQVAAEPGECERADDDREESEAARQAIDKKHVVRAGEMTRERERSTQRAEQPGTALFARIRVVPDEGQREGRPESPQREKRNDERDRNRERGRKRAIAREPPRRTDQQRGNDRGVRGEKNEIRKPAPRDAAAETRFHVEAERVADAGHRECVADQQQDERQRMLHRRGQRKCEPGRQQMANGQGKGLQSRHCGFRHPGYRSWSAPRRVYRRRRRLPLIGG